MFVPSHLYATNRRLVCSWGWLVDKPLDRRFWLRFGGEYSLSCNEDLHDRDSEVRGYGSFRKLGVPDFGVLIIRILLFRGLY